MVARFMIAVDECIIVSRKIFVQDGDNCKILSYVASYVLFDQCSWMRISYVYVDIHICIRVA